MKYLLLSFLIPIVILYSCKSGKILTINENEIHPLILDKKFNFTEQIPMFNIDTSYIHSSTLTVHVSYVGGCEKQNFQLYSKGELTKSIPPLTHFYLHSTAKTDSCHKKVQHILMFDVSPFKQRYKKTLRISINKYPHELIYEP